MKNLILALVMCAGAGASAKDVVLNLNDVLVPATFSSANEVIILVSGYYPNSCYSWKTAMVNHFEGNIHEVRALAEVRQGMCLMVMIPYEEQISLGRLPVGHHSLRAINGDGTAFERTFEVN